MQGEEKYQTEGFKEIALIYGTAEDSFRKTALLINRIRHQKVGGTPFRTMREVTEHEGRLLQEHIEQKTSRIFQENGFTPEGYPEEAIVNAITPSPSILAEAELAERLVHYDLLEDDKSEMETNPVPYEDAETAIHISVDDVGVKKQKENREKKTCAPRSKKNRERVQNTVIHVDNGGRSYILNGYGILCMLRILLAFLLHNEFLSKKWVFFVDGNGLYKSVLEFFSWHRNLSVILDWYHLKKKCQELLSMTMKGREIRNEVLEKLLPLLWHGLVDQAIRYLKSLPECEIKNEEQRGKLISYVDRNRPMIPVYAIRKELGLRNSSNRGEKANDLIVAQRQKHNGMSWSKSGSVSLATVAALKKNKEYPKWFRDREIEFKLVA